MKQISVTATVEYDERLTSAEQITDNLKEHIEAEIRAEVWPNASLNNIHTIPMRKGRA